MINAGVSAYLMVFFREFFIEAPIGWISKNSDNSIGTPIPARLFDIHQKTSIGRSD
ncbi:MAG: hypothetical protein WCD70_00180 [Alphaproteobacteria bacterium]